MDGSIYARLLELVGAEPFVPSDIRTTDGHVYTVDSPDYFARSRTGQVVTYITEDNRYVNIRAKEIAALEVENRPAA